MLGQIKDMHDAAKQRVARAFCRRPTIRIRHSVSPDGKAVVTSPDADWLYVVASSSTEASAEARYAVERVARWCRR